MQFSTYPLKRVHLQQVDGDWPFSLLSTVNKFNNLTKKGLDSGIGDQKNYESVALNKKGLNDTTEFRSI
jgi:hypothetical protein